MKKAVYPPLPLCIGSYKFTKVKSAPNFVRELEGFHFEEKRFHINDSCDKVLKYCAFVGVHFEYSHYFHKDEKVYWNTYNMTSLNKHFKMNMTTKGGKGSSSTAEQQKKKEEDAKKQEEDAWKLVEEAKKLLA